MLPLDAHFQTPPVPSAKQVIEVRRQRLDPGYFKTLVVMPPVLPVLPGVGGGWNGVEQMKVLREYREKVGK